MLFIIAQEAYTELFWETCGRDYTENELTLALWAEDIANAYGVVVF